MCKNKSSTKIQIKLTWSDFFARWVEETGSCFFSGGATVWGGVFSGGGKGTFIGEGKGGSSVSVKVAVLVTIVLAVVSGDGFVEQTATLAIAPDGTSFGRGTFKVFISTSGFGELGLSSGTAGR